VIFLTGVLPVLAGCGTGVTGSYSCAGMPDIATLTLETDGSYTSNGSILGHATPGTGKYTLDPGHVTLAGSYRVEGLTQVEANKVVFDRQSNGELKSLLTTCTKQ
jgi:hypothetical protein